MKQVKPLFNIVTPKNIKYIFKYEKRQFIERLSKLIEMTKVSSLRIHTANLNSEELVEISNDIKQLCSNKILIIIENDIELAVRLSLDGVHLTNGQKLVKKAKLLLSENQVVGAFCGLSKHSALVAAEHGADYIAFNASYRSSQKTEEIAELFKWWSEFIEIPVMGECQNDYPIPRRIWNHCDFFSIGDKVWQPESAVNSFSEPYEFEY